MDDRHVTEKVTEFFNQAAPTHSSSIGSPHPDRVKPKRLKISLTITALLLTACIAWAGYTLYQTPTGKFTNPPANSKVDRIFEIQGITKRIPPERRYIWVTVDVPHLKLCWPKRQIYRPNTPFSTKIVEEGPNLEFIVSMYAVDYAMHKEITNWFEECLETKAEAGMQILPEEWRLTSITLELEPLGEKSKRI